MQGAVGVLYPYNYKVTRESSSEKIVNRFRVDRIMVMSIWSHFLAHPVYEASWSTKLQQIRSGPCLKRRRIANHKIKKKTGKSKYLKSRPNGFPIKAQKQHL